MKVKPGEFYLKELNDYLRHCKDKGFTPRFHYMRFLKSHLTNEEIEYNKIIDRIFPYYRYNKKAK